MDLRSPRAWTFALATGTAAAAAPTGQPTPPKALERSSLEQAPSPRQRPGPGPVPPQANASPLSAGEHQALAQWLTAVGPRRRGEAFGRLVARVGRIKLGVTYDDPPQRDAPERLEITVSKLQCVSFVEATLAIARCVWLSRDTEACVVEQMQAFRYRDGKIDGFPSRLHYFADWLDDNTRRRRLRDVTAALGGRQRQQPFSYMTDRPHKFPALEHASNREAVRADEARLSNTPFAILDREAVRVSQRNLRSGDLIAFVGNKRGILIAHAGFIDRSHDGKPRVLHASSFHQRVLITTSDVAGYVMRRPERIGIVVVRPTPP